jgi:hypothetical protein
MEYSVGLRAVGGRQEGAAQESHCDRSYRTVQ